MDIKEETGKGFFLPDWVYNPPREKEVFFGLGLGTSLYEAQQKSIVDAGQQFNVMVRTILSRTDTDNNGIDESSFQKVSNHFTNQKIYGARFVEQFEDSTGTWWVLVRVPINCMLDVAESVFLSYQFELKQESAKIGEIINKIGDAFEEQTEWLERKAGTEYDILLEAIENKKLSDASDLTEQANPFSKELDLEEVNWRRNFFSIGAGYGHSLMNSPGGEISSIIFSHQVGLSLGYTFALNKNFGMGFGVNGYASIPFVFSIDKEVAVYDHSTVAFFYTSGAGLTVKLMMGDLKKNKTAFLIDGTIGWGGGVSLGVMVKAFTFKVGYFVPGILYLPLYNQNLFTSSITAEIGIMLNWASL